MRSLLLLLPLLLTSPLCAGDKDGRLDIYFIDVEGGAATLLVTPVGQSILIDSGYPDNQGRDRDRILRVVKEIAGCQRLDHAVVSHWHLDHFGNHAALAALIPIVQFWDRGMPETLAEDPKYPERIELYRAASQNGSTTLRAGDSFDLPAKQTPFNVRVLTASGEVVPNEGPANRFAADHKPQPEDTSDNAKSVSLLFRLGDFTFLTCGDLTWNTEAKLVTPNNPVGEVDLFMVTHHGLEVSNNPVLVWAIAPRVAVMCNGPEKGCHANTWSTLRQCDSLQAVFQLHRNVKLAAADQTPAEFIANTDSTATCKGKFVKASVAPDGKSYTLSIEGADTTHTFQTRSP
jgi:competence protein ComEC